MTSIAKSGVHQLEICLLLVALVVCELLRAVDALNVLSVAFVTCLCLFVRSVRLSHQFVLVALAVATVANAKRATVNQSLLCNEGKKMAEKKTRERKQYSVYRLEWCEPQDDPGDPDTKWKPLAYFTREQDAVTAKGLLEDTKEWSKRHFSLVREIRERAPRDQRARKTI